MEVVERQMSVDSVSSTVFSAIDYHSQTSRSQSISSISSTETVQRNPMESTQKHVQVQVHVQTPRPSHTNPQKPNPIRRQRDQKYEYHNASPIPSTFLKYMEENKKWLDEFDKPRK